MAPLAYMRGRTLDDSFISWMKPRNATTEQMKMFLTRLGFGSKAVVTGDITADLPRGKYSGLIAVQKILREVPGLFLLLRTGVVASVVQRIIQAYHTTRNAGLAAKGVIVQTKEQPVLAAMGHVLRKGQCGRLLGLVVFGAGCTHGGPCQLACL